MNTNHYTIISTQRGYIVRPSDHLDNARWYFHSLTDAYDHAAYLEHRYHTPMPDHVRQRLMAKVKDVFGTK